MVAALLTGVAAGASALPAVATLPDRAYEQVTPPDKGAGDPLSLTGFHHVSVSGERVFFQADGAFKGGDFALEANYLAERGSGSWSTAPIEPRVPRRPEGGTYWAFTPDLSEGLLTTGDVPDLVPDDNLGIEDIYLRDQTSGSLRLVTTQPPVSPGFRPLVFGSTNDLRHVIFTRNEDTVYFPDEPDSPNVYHADVAEGEMRLVSIIPDDSTADPDDEMPAPEAAPGSGLTDSDPANGRLISQDGSRIFFTALDRNDVLSTLDSGPANGAQLYARVNVGTAEARTLHVSAPEPGASDPSGRTWAAWFRGASADGSKVFFTSCERLTADSTADTSGAVSDGQDWCPPDRGTRADLYLFNLEANGGSGDLVDLTTADPTGADVLGFVGASRDGSRAYFVATGTLDAGAVAGEPNLYLWEEGSGIRLIATLSAADGDVSLGDPSRSTEAKDSRLTPDGRYLAFASKARLAPGFDNAGHSQVYLYDAVADELECASCAGAGPASADATLKNQSGVGGHHFSPLFEKQNLTDDGAHLFFEAGDALVGGDANGEVDVYEYDTASGKLGLVSSGTGDGPSAFVGASASGDDAFFTTRERLVGWDRDGAVDIYDARVGGGFPEPPDAAPDCGLDCQGPPARLAPLVDPGSVLLQGLGNLIESPDRDLAVRRLSRRQRARLARGRRVGLRVRVHRAGLVRVVARARVGRLVRRRIRGRVRIVRRVRRVLRGSRRAREAGTVLLPLRLSRRARRRLARREPLRVAVVVGFAGERRRLAMTLRRRGRRRAGRVSAPRPGSRRARRGDGGTR